jgi:fatty acid desaturase
MPRVVKPNDVLSADEIRAFTRTSDLAGAWALVTTWGVVAATFWALARWPHPLGFAAAVVVLGGRQLALAVAMHEAAHGTLFHNRLLNEIGGALCGWPVWADVARYRKHHLVHHNHTGTERDPDLALTTPFPTTRASLVRKVARDLLGLSGIKRVIGLSLVDLELLQYTVSSETKRLPWRGALHHARAGARNLPRVLVANVALAGALALAGHAWVYLAWLTAFLTTYSLVLRVRSIAEHACLDKTADPFRNTRTTRANPLARVLVAPLHVNYHLEHHLVMTVPWFRLPALHRVLVERGVLKPTAIAPGYLAVLQTASAAPRAVVDS